MVGRALIPRLSAAGFDCRLLLRASSKTDPYWKTATIVRGDLTQPESLQSAAQGVDAVIHLAALVHRSGGESEAQRVNAVGTRDLARAAAAAGARRFIYLSSIAVYDPNARQPFTEETACRPEGPYGASKLAGEESLRREAEASSMKWVILRPSVIYGEHDRGNTLRLVRAIDRGWFVRVGNGNARKSMTYVQNVVDALLASLAHPHPGGRVFNVSDRRAYGFDDVAAAIARSLERPLRRLSIPRSAALFSAGVVETLLRPTRLRPPVRRRDVEVATRDTVCSVEALRRTLGYEARVDLRNGIDRTVSWYLANRR